MTNGTPETELLVVYDNESAKKIISQVESFVGTIQTLERVSGGYVHYVFKVIGEETTAYLKARSNHFARLPHIETDPARIAEEYKALQLYLQYCSEYFPQILHFDADNHYLLLTELLPGISNLETRFLTENVSLSEIQNLGAALATIHRETSGVMEPIRDPDDKLFKENLFKYVLEYFQHPRLLQTANEHRERPTQLLIGDSSPKNVLLDASRIGLCDLEGSHQGSIVYDQAFMLSHILLHQENKRKALQALESFSEGYRKENGFIDFDDTLLPQTIQGILLYRLDNPLIPYTLNRTQEDRKESALRIYNSLSAGTTDMEEIIHALMPE